MRPGTSVSSEINTKLRGPEDSTGSLPHPDNAQISAMQTLAAIGEARSNILDSLRLGADGSRSAASTGAATLGVLG